MATAKTTKSVPAAKPAAVKPPVPKAVAKPVAKPAAAVKPAAVAAPTTAAPKPAPVARAAAEKPAEEAVVHSAKIVPEPAPQPLAKPAAPKPAEPVVEAVAKPAKAVAVVAKATHDAGETVLKGVAPLLEFSRDNAILLVSTGNQLALGLHKLSLSLLDWSAESCDKGVAASQAILSAKTVEEVFDLSQSLAKDSLEQFLKEGSELSKLSAKLIEDTIVPLPSRLVAAVEKLASHAP